MWRIHKSPGISLTKGQWGGTLMFSLICAWKQSWVNNHDPGDLKWHHTYFDITVMCPEICRQNNVTPVGQCRLLMTSSLVQIWIELLYVNTFCLSIKNIELISTDYSYEISLCIFYKTVSVVVNASLCKWCLCGLRVFGCFLSTLSMYIQLPPWLLEYTLLSQFPINITELTAVA